MAITGQDIADRVETLLQDTTNVRWPEDELRQWINDGQREVVAINPSALTETQVQPLNNGTRQELPSDAVQLIDVSRNMAGGSPGRAVRLVERKALDEQRPDWHSDSQTTEAKHYTHDARDPRRFYVWPPNDGSGEVEVIYSATPTDLSDLSEEVALPDIYANALVNYTVFRALSKDAEYTGSQQAANYYEMFQSLVSHRAQIEGHTMPGASMEAASLRTAGRRNAAVGNLGNSEG